ncbi:MAG: WecB/TagA/CpsF family glycosyltransferase [Thermoflavifilum sp.]|nr:WecB/TagA/CpsF family glycosyltransferase [Thermoflavifilum sp.]MCL6515064.1 WecB/TagA/CpsF family glycosyltransferase [Alicyclobacillus sp.]
MTALTWGEALPEQQRVTVLGVPFDRLTRRQAVERILHWIDQRQHRMVITAGPEFVMQVQQAPELQRLARLADLVTPDGIGIVWAARRLGKPVPERVTGVELVPEILATAAERGQPLKVYMLGAKPEVLDAALNRLQREYPALEFAGHHGYFSADEWLSIRDQIRAFAPQLWLVGLGQPRQERVIFENLASLPPCVAIGIGGSIDVWSGAVRRAPAWMRRLHLEWFYRLVREPRRWRRQLALPRFAWKVLRNPALSGGRPNHPTE